MPGSMIARGAETDVVERSLRRRLIDCLAQGKVQVPSKLEL